MRPVNLIPPEDRRGDSAPSRTGVLAYLIIGVLVMALVVVSARTIFGNQISEREAEVEGLQGQVDVAEARAASLASYTSLQGIRDARVVTIDALAKSRFDWERVLRELARVVPEGVFLNNVTGTVSSQVSVEGAATVALRDTVPGPALELVGCAGGQRDVARLIAAMHDIDGVTRVAAVEGVRGDSSDTDSGSTTAPGGGCPSPGDAAFQLVAAFDAIPVPAGAVPAIDGSTTVATTAPAAPATDSAAPADESASAESAQAQEQISNAAGDVNDAANLAPGG